MILVQLLQFLPVSEFLWRKALWGLSSPCHRFEWVNEWVVTIPIEAGVPSGYSNTWSSSRRSSWLRERMLGLRIGSDYFEVPLLCILPWVTCSLWLPIFYIILSAQIGIILIVYLNFSGILAYCMLGATSYQMPVRAIFFASLFAYYTIIYSWFLFCQSSGRNTDPWR